MNCGLFMSPMGEIGIASDPLIANVPDSVLEEGKCPNVFITTFGYKGTASLKALIDTNTFRKMGADLYMDKNHIYSFYAMCAGGQFNIFASDTTSFKMLNDYYFTFKGGVYHFRKGLLDADIQSFQTSNEFGQYARDKRGYFFFGARISKKAYEKDSLDLNRSSRSNVKTLKSSD